MPPVPIALLTRPPSSDTPPADAPADEMVGGLIGEVTVIGDLDKVVETTMCSCAAGDDAPY